MISKRPLTKKQSQVLEFIRKYQEQHGHSPTLREIAAYRDVNVTAVVDHIRSLKTKGYLAQGEKTARSLRILSPFEKLRKRSIDIPVFGSIPAGYPLDRAQDAKAVVTVDVGSIGIKPTARTFALEVKGDSMIGKHIVPGDIVILEHGVTPKAGDVVAALVDRESTLKTYETVRGKPVLKAENPKYKEIIPAEELVIQGVMVALIRKRR